MPRRPIDDDATCECGQPVANIEDPRCHTCETCKRLHEIQSMAARGWPIGFTSLDVRLASGDGEGF